MLFIDTETYGTLDLRKVGSYRYAYHEDTEVLLFQCAVDGAEPVVIDVDGRVLLDALREDAPEIAERLLTDEPIVMHNSNFDRHIIAGQGIGLDVGRIWDTMVIAYTLGLPGRLDLLGEALGLPADLQKMKRGKSLISRFCKPAPKNHKADRYDKYTHPEEWDEFVAYGKQDIITMREAYKRMTRYNITDAERRIWLLDQEINDRGVRVDFQLVRAALELADRRQEEITSEIESLTWGEVIKHTKSTAILEYCQDAGLRLPNLRKETVAAALEGDHDMPPDVRRLLQLRAEANKATVSKYTALGARTSQDGRLRGGLQYGGASRTLRWAGRGVQLHNLARPPYWLDQELAARCVIDGTAEAIYPDPLDVVKGVVRGAFIPADGCLFAVSDLSNIEGRLTAWVADETWKIEAFREFDAGTGPDIYKATYSKSFGVPVGEVTGDQRQVGKVQELAGGYQGWVGAWRTFEAAYGLPEMEEEQVIETMGAWRDAHPRVRSTWGNLEELWRMALDEPGKSFTLNERVTARFYPKRDLLALWLPSGRFVPYLHPKADSAGLRFKGLDDKSRWSWIDTYGGKLLENIVQAIARDVLAHAMLKVEHPIVLHVHDEIVLEVPEAQAEDALDDLNRTLSTPPEWAADLPLAAKGFICNRYRKE